MGQGDVMTVSQSVRRRLTWMALIFYLLVMTLYIADLITGAGGVTDHLLILAVMIAWLPIWWYVQHHF